MDGNECEEHAEHHEEGQGPDGHANRVDRYHQLGSGLPQLASHRDPSTHPGVFERPGHRGADQQRQGVVGEVPSPAEEVGGGSAEEREDGQEAGDDSRVLTQ